MLPRRYRLCSNKDFRKTYARGKSFVHPMLVLYVRRRTGETNGAVRVGFSISKKLGNAVVRNRIKRQLREAFQASEVKWSDPLDLIFVGRGKLSKADFASINASLGELLSKANVKDTKLMDLFPTDLDK